jgi:MFS family permease
MLRNVRLLYIHNFLSDFWPQYPYLVVYFQPIAHSYVSAMSVLAVETLTAALMDIPTGIFSDRLGRRLTIAFGSFSAALGAALYAGADGLLVLYIGAFFTGLSQCLFSGNNNALLYETLKAEGIEGQFHHYRAKTGSMYQLALCLSALSAIFFSHYGLRFVFVVAIVPQVFAIFVSLMFSEPRIHIAEKQKSWAVLKQACISIYRNPRLMLLVAGKAINYGAGEAGFKFKGAFVNALWPTWAVGLYRGLGHAVSFVGFWVAGHAFDRIKPAFIFVIRDIYWFFGNISAVLLNNVFSPFPLIIGSFFFGPGEVASDHLMHMEFTDQQRATMGSLASSASSIVFAIVALGIGVISDSYDLGTGMIFCAFIQLTSLPVYAWLFRRELGFKPRKT